MGNTGFNVKEAAEFYVMLLKKFDELEENIGFLKEPGNEMFKTQIHDLKSAAGNLCIKGV